MRITNQFKSKLYTYFIKRGLAHEYRKGWLRLYHCPYCGRDEKLGVNLTMYRTNCFRCNAHVSPAQLVMDIEGFDTWAELTAFLNNGDFTELTFKEEKVELLEKKPVYLPEGFRNIAIGKSQLAKSMRGYVKKRGFDIKYASRVGIGYCTTGSLYGYLVIPFYYNGELRYYNARAVMSNGPRYNNPNKDITGLGKEFIIFNHDALSMYKKVFLCEGAINALTMGEQGIATMGKAVSAYQINEIIKSPVERIIILLDPDAKKYALELAMKLVHYKSVKVVYLPEGTDVNDLGKKETLKYIYNTKYQSYRELQKLKNEL